MSPSVGVARLPESDAPAAGALLATAFRDDPLTRYLFPEPFPDPAERDRLLGWHYTALVRYGQLAGQVYATSTSGALEGVAVWLTGGEPVDPLARLESLQRAGLHEAPTMLGAATFQRILGVVGHLEAGRRRIAPGPHWYLNQVGVDPRRRGKGLGSALLRPVLDLAAATGVPCYLETFAPQNLAFYRRLGFDTVVEDIEPGSGLPYWMCLRRPPSQPVLNPA